MDCNDEERRRKLMKHLPEFLALARLVTACNKGPYALPIVVVVLGIYCLLVVGGPY